MLKRKYKSGIYNQLGFESSQIIGVRYGAKYGDYSEYRVNGFQWIFNIKLNIDAKRTR